MSAQLRETMVKVIGEASEAPRSLAQSRRRAQTAAEQAIAVLRSEGYYGASVKMRVDEFTPEPGQTTRRRPEPVLIIEPGTQFRFSDVNITYDGPEPDVKDAVMKTLALQAQNPAKAAQIVAAELRAVNYLRAHGYPEAVAKPSKPIVNHDTQTMQVNFVLFAGPKTRFGDINQTGTAYILTSWPDMISPFDTGDVFDDRALNKLAARVTATGIFDGATAVLEDTKTNNPDGTITRNVLLNVEQGAINTVSGQVGYSTTDGSGVELSYERRNFIGYAQRLILSTTLKTNEISAEADYNIPYAWRVDRELDVGAIVSREDTDAYTGERAETTVDVTQKISSKLKVSLGIGAEASQYEENGETVRAYLLDGRGNIAYDARDSILDPVTGFVVNAEAIPTYNFGNNADYFTTLEATASAYQRVSPKLVAAARISAGTIFGTAQDNIPLNRRFYSGGGGSVRGFGYQSISPRNAADELIGGRSLAEASAELRYRGDSPFGFAAFVDAGSVDETTMPDLSDIRYGAGVGLRYFTNFAPIRADIAIPLNKRDGDAAFQVYFSIGQAF